MVLVDTNVILDVITNDPKWADWSQHQLDGWSLRDDVAINAVDYSELSITCSRIDDLDAMIITAGFGLFAIPREALFLAGKVFPQYRRSGGTKTGVLPDFFVGAHAAVASASLLKCDVVRIFPVSKFTRHSGRGRLGAGIASRHTVPISEHFHGMCLHGSFYTSPSTSGAAFPPTARSSARYKLLLNFFD